jgi:AcrR family transcriptional regulator
MAKRSKTAGSLKRARRQRNPLATRQAILESARGVLAQNGAGGLSVLQVARRAGVDRRTAYQYFPTRDQLIEATNASVGERLYQEVFGDPAITGNESVESINIAAVIRHMATFAMKNPSLCRVWLFELLSSQQPASDPFWGKYESNFERFAQTEYAQPRIDTEVAAVLMLAGSFLWPVWARADSLSAAEQTMMAERFAREIIRLSLHGTLRPDKYVDLIATLEEEPGDSKASRDRNE